MPPLSIVIIIIKLIIVIIIINSLTTNHEVSGSIPGSTMGIFPCRERFPW